MSDEPQPEESQAGKDEKEKPVEDAEDGEDDEDEGEDGEAEEEEEEWQDPRDSDVYHMEWLLGEENTDPDEYVLIIGYDYMCHPIWQKYNDLEDIWYPEYTLKNLSELVPFAMHENKMYMHKHLFPGEQFKNKERHLVVFDFQNKTEPDHFTDAIIPAFQTGKGFNGKIFGLEETGELSALNLADFSVTPLLNLNPTPESRVELLIHEGLLYAFGDFPDHVACLRFDIDTMESKTIAPFPLEHDYRCEEKPGVKVKLSAAAWRGKIYVIEEDSLSEMFEYNPKSDKWETIQPDQPLSISFGKMLCHKDRLMCVDRYCTVSRYNDEDNEWIHKTDCEGSLMYDDRSDVVQGVFSVMDNRE